MDASKYLTVSDLNYYLGQKFKQDPYLRKVYLQGEISNFRLRRNAHQYFSLKDEKAKIDCIMFRSSFEKIKFKPEEGMKVYVSGYVNIYEAGGAMNFVVQTMEPAGLGALYEQLRQLQEKLAKEGLFDQAHKKPLPHFPDRIAVVTSPSGAVVHDIMITANRRFPHAEIDIFPAVVQGDKAADSLVSAMQQIEANQDRYDVMIIGRGGGSLEDLWPFNEEKVVRQVYAMSIPVISSVGHETDTTLCDLVADQRAATPTAAAEYATPNLPEELANLHQLASRLLAAMQNTIRVRRQYLDRIANSVVLREPTRLYDQQSQKLDLLKNRLSRVIDNELKQSRASYKLALQKLIGNSPEKRVVSYLEKRAYLSKMLTDQMQHYLADKRNDYEKAKQRLADISPQKTLDRGFAYTTDEHDRMIASSSDLSQGMKLILHFKDGEAEVVVNEIRRNQDGRREK